MTKTSLCAFLLLGHILSARVCAAPPNGVDPRALTVSKTQWQQQVAKTKIESPKNALLLGQAANSKLAEFAFSHYGKVKKQQPKNPYAALYYGQAARLYYQELLPLSADPTGKRQRAIQVANANMAFAVEKLPRSAYAHMVYGYFLWQFYNEMDRGLTMVRKARQLDPKAANIASTLGLMYSNRSGNCYDLEQAERAYRAAIKLDPKFASARYGFAYVLKERKKDDEAAKQLIIASSLSPKKQ